MAAATGGGAFSSGSLGKRGFVGENRSVHQGGLWSAHERRAWNNSSIGTTLRNVMVTEKKHP